MSSMGEYFGTTVLLKIRL